MNYLHQVKSFQPNARRFLIATFLAGFGGSVFGLLYNLYLLSLGQREDFIGLVASATTLTTALSGPLVVLLAPRLGFGRILALGFFFQVIASTGQALSTAPVAILAFATVWGLSAGFYWAPLPPFLAENSSPGERNHLFAINLAVQLVAGILGSLVGGQLPLLLGTENAGLGTLNTYRITLLLATGVAGLALLPMLRMRYAVPQTHTGRDLREASAAEERAGRRGILALGVSALTMGIAIGLSFPFFNVYFAKQQGAGAEMIGRIFALNSVMSTFAALSAPALAQRLGYVRAISLGRGASGLALVGLAASPSLTLAVGAFWLRTLLLQMMSPLIDAFGMAIAPPRLRGLQSSVTSTFWHLGYSISSLAAGLAIVQYGFAPVFVVAAGIMLLNAVIFLAYFRNWRMADGK